MYIKTEEINNNNKGVTKNKYMGKNPLVFIIQYNFQNAMQQAILQKYKNNTCQKTPVVCWYNMSYSS